MTNTAYEQPELPLEWPVHDHYTVELRKGAVGEMEPVRSMQAPTVEDAISLIESFRDLAANRDGVTWRDNDVDNHGDLYGLAKGGIVWQIHVTPDLNTELG